jgi:hypothetical protein
MRLIDNGGALDPVLALLANARVQTAQIPSPL